MYTAHIKSLADMPYQNAETKYTTASTSCVHLELYRGSTMRIFGSEIATFRYNKRMPLREEGDCPHNVTACK